MHIFKHVTKRSKILLSSLIFLAVSCSFIQIKDTIQCEVAGLISNGMICSHSIANETHILSFGESLDFLEAQGQRTCVPVPGMNVCSDDQIHGTPSPLPARGAAISMSSSDWDIETTELEQACRALGSSCTKELQQAIQKRLKMTLSHPSPYPTISPH